MGPPSASWMPASAGHCWHAVKSVAAWTKELTTRPNFSEVGASSEIAAIRLVVPHLGENHLEGASTIAPEPSSFD